MTQLRHEPVTAFIALGANLPSAVGDARATVLWAMAQIKGQEGVQHMRCSSLYRSAPMHSCGDDYINAVVSVSVRQPVYSLLKLLQKIEHMAGRERPYHNAPRTLDLDLLFYGDARIESDWLIVPHPRWKERAFVLHPLREIAPERVNEALLVPVANQVIEKLEGTSEYSMFGMKR